ncbi:MAG: hypothetical protein HPY53_16980 [Brevinematales bacterium]|nr:hypothetical protein [Brevinematales bacterium]
MYYGKEITALNEAGVEYLIAGGVAVALHGYPRHTYDIDIIASLEKENFKILITTLGDIGYAFDSATGPEPGYRDLKDIEDIKDLISIRFINRGDGNKVIDLVIDHGLDFKKAYDRVFLDRIEEVVYPVLSYEDLKKMKEELGRDEDIKDIEHLEAAREAKKKSWPAGSWTGDGKIRVRTPEEDKQYEAHLSSSIPHKNVLEWLEDNNRLFKKV